MNRILFIALLFFLSMRSVAQDISDIQQDSIEIEVTDTTLVDSMMVDKQLTVQQRVDKLLEAKMFKTSQVAIMVYDLTADSVVYAYNEKQTLRPASTMKLTTAITAIDRLGESYRYATKLKYKGAIYDASVPSDEQKKNVLVGNIILVGGMDPRFGRDDMNAFVEALLVEHIDTIYGEVMEDRSFKDSDMLGEGWCWDDKNPVLTPMLWNRKDEFRFKFMEMARDAGIVIRPKAEIPVDSLGNSLYTTQKETTATLITRHHTIDQILVKMMKDSDNLYAETMFYQIAANVTNGKRPGRAKDAATAIKNVMRAAGANPSEYRIADGSGLSLYNYQSAELQVKLLRYAYNNANIYGHLYPSLPIAGVDGTLKSRMAGTKAKGNVHAKTGTVTGVSSLAGYLTADNGNLLCFSIINQGVLSSSPAKTFQDRVCNIMCSY